MVKLRSLPENYFQNNKFQKKIYDSNNKYIGKIDVRHFLGSMSPYKMYTFIKCEIFLPNNNKNASNYNYDFSIDFDENMELDDFEIEFDKIFRKWTKIIEIILKEVEII